MEQLEKEIKQDNIIIDKRKQEKLKLAKMLLKKDKIIDLMAEQLAGLTIWNIEEDEPLILRDEEEAKQYFEREV